MELTKEHIHAIAPAVTEANRDLYVPLINAYQGEVNTPLRICAFLAQILHESGCFRYREELASGHAYEGRADLGNTEPGDGVKFKGRGLIQVTGRFNYEKLGKALYDDAEKLINEPELLATPENAVRSAYWFWQAHHLNTFADTGDLTTITKRINGGLNGWAERNMYYQRALKIIV